jgi:hypothetical protein
LGAHNDIDSGPADAGENVENGDCPIVSFEFLIFFGGS